MIQLMRCIIPTLLWMLVSIVVCADTDNGIAKPSAKSLMVAVDKRYEGKTRKQNGIMVLIDKNKNKRIREFKEIVKHYGEDKKSITQVMSPPEVRGTTFLSYDWDKRDREDESWLYLPQLRKTKRLATTDKSGYFLGSDFTYGDLIGLEVEDFNYAYVDDDKAIGAIRSLTAIPRQDIRNKVIDETGYIKIKYWVDKEKKMIIKAQYWLDEGRKVKYLSVSDIGKVKNIWTAFKMQMITTQGERMLHASIFEIRDVKYNMPVEDKAFSVYAMERDIE